MKPLNRLWNVEGRGGVQTVYTRFLETPGGGVRSAFSDAKDAFEKSMAARLKTAYDDIWRGERT